MSEQIKKKNSVILSVDETVLRRLSVLIRDQMGLDFTSGNLADLERGLLRATEDFGFQGADAAQRCAEKLIAGPLSNAQIEILAGYLTIGETYFFRDPALFELLRAHVWPALLQLNRAAGRRELRIWSAACCSGEEPYSLAMQLHTLLPRLLPDWKAWKVTILATDLNPAFLKKAETAIYSAWSFRSAAQQEQKLYFDEISEGRFQLKAEIRRYVQFAPFNLITGQFPTLGNGTAQQDIIFCRNVLMYFAPQQARAVALNLIQCLNEGGYLVPAASEASQSLFAPLVTAPLPGAILYQKPVSAPLLEPRSRPMERPLVKNVTPPVKARATTSVAPKKPEPASAPISAQDKLAEEWQEKARLSAGLGHLDEALVFCDLAIQENKMVARYYYLRASILLEKPASENENTAFPESEAEVALRRALYLEPDFALAHFVLGNLERRRGRAAAARRSWQNALRLLEESPPESLLDGGEDLTVGHAIAMIERGLSTLNESTLSET